jgi:hypothetical protein
LEESEVVHQKKFDIQEVIQDVKIDEDNQETAKNVVVNQEDSDAESETLSDTRRRLEKEKEEWEQSKA